MQNLIQLGYNGWKYPTCQVNDVMIDVTSNNSNVVYELGLEETVATLLKLLHLSIGLGATTFNLLRSRQ